MQKPVYLDYAATTPVDPRVAAVMTQCLTMDGNFGNPASRSHIYGWQAEEAVERARGQLADLIQADPREIVWTSGATESDNLALKGIAHRHQDQGKHLITSCIEHKAVLDSCAQLQREGFEVSYLQPTAAGIIEPEQVAGAIRQDTILVSLMHANNEIGTLTDIARVGAICRQHGVLFHVDGAQSVGKLAIDMGHLPVDLMSISAHKMYGPKGIGALYVRRVPKLHLEAQIHGGGHERGMRSGTLATHQIVGLGEAARIAGEALVAESIRIGQLRDRLWQGIQTLGEVYLNGDFVQRLPGNLNVSFAGVDGESLLIALKDLAISTGSACASASIDPSYVLQGLGLSQDLALSALRFSPGRYTNEEDIDFAVECIQQAVSRLRGAGVIGQEAVRE
jgi:cysteine desulfurase